MDKMQIEDVPVPVEAMGILKRLGLDKGKAWAYDNTRLGYWRIANSPIQKRTLTDKYLESLGYMNIA